jgi:hypothetical protein
MIEFIIIRRFLVFLTKWLVFSVFLFFVLPSNKVSAQNESEYDEISVFLEVPRVGGGEIAAIISGEKLYLPVTDLFDFLKIRNTSSPGLDSIQGFFINPDAKYVINRTEKRIRYQDKIIKLTDGDLIRTESNLYMRSTYFGSVFGLDCKFNFRSLSVTVVSKLELPLIKEMRQEEMRRNLTRLKGEIKADTTITRSHPLFKFGVADWSAVATEEINGQAETRLNLTLGSMIAGGEATASINYNTTDHFNEKQQYYLWRYVNNDFKPLRQIMAGKIISNSISSLYNPVLGVTLTNTPTTFRRSFGSYTLSDRTEPGWIVELYVNNVLVDYVKADASGFFTFEVPLVYGNSMVKLKFLGPWGEERTREQNISIPFNFLPVNTMEYTVSGGIVEDSLQSRYSRASVNYGLTRSLTIGGGVEYLSSVISHPAMPYLNTSLRITNNILISAEYVAGVRAKGTLTYRLPSNLQLDLNYTLYDRNQKAINFNYREERKAVLSVPIHTRKYSSYQRFSFYQIILPSSKYSTGEWLYSGSLLGINTNLTTYALFIQGTNPYLYSNLSLAIRLPAGINFMPQVQFSYTRNNLISAKLTLEKYLFQHAFLNLSYEQNFRNNLNMVELGLRYDFSFAQMGTSIRQSNKKSTLIQYARGSLINDRKTRFLGADNRTNVGKGGISIVAFMDLNSNGKKDPGEPKAYGLNLHANGGHVEKSDRDSTIRILGLEPYTSCFIELDPNSFENISWRIPCRTLSVYVNPNMIKNIEIPVAVMGESTGTVELDKNGEKKGQGRIIIGFYTIDNKPAGKTLTEDNGYFSYSGLTAGNYFVKVDTIQLRKLKMTSDPESRQFSIAPGIEGDIVEGLDFILKIMPGDTTSVRKVTLAVRDKQATIKDTTFITVHEITQELVTITEDSYAIQLGAFKNKSNAEVLRTKLARLIGKTVEIVNEEGFFKVRITELKDRKDVDENIEILRQNGVTEVWLISLKAKHQTWVTTEKQDSIAKVTEHAMQKPDSVIILKLSTIFRVFPKEFYKLHIGRNSLLDPTVLDVMKKDFTISKVEFSDIWISPVVRQAEPEPEPEPDILRNREQMPERIEYWPEILSVYKPDLMLRFMIVKSNSSLIHPEPTISLQVAVFYKQSKAIRAQRKISAKLKLPVQVVKQWDYYKVIIRGFYNREETYKYYPELAGLGYPGISLIEE